MEKLLKNLTREGPDLNGNSPKSKTISKKKQNGLPAAVKDQVIAPDGRVFYPCRFCNKVFPVKKNRTTHLRNCSAKSYILSVGDGFSKNEPPPELQAQKEAKSPPIKLTIRRNPSEHGQPPNFTVSNSLVLKEKNNDEFAKIAKRLENNAVTIIKQTTVNDSLDSSFPKSINFTDNLDSSFNKSHNSTSTRTSNNVTISKQTAAVDDNINLSLNKSHDNRTNTRTSNNLTKSKQTAFVNNNINLSVNTIHDNNTSTKTSNNLTKSKQTAAVVNDNINSSFNNKSHDNNTSTSAISNDLIKLNKDIVITSTNADSISDNNKPSSSSISTLPVDDIPDICIKDNQENDILETNKIDDEKSSSDTVNDLVTSSSSLLQLEETLPKPDETPQPETVTSTTDGALSNTSSLSGDEDVDANETTCRQCKKEFKKPLEMLRHARKCHSSFPKIVMAMSEIKKFYSSEDRSSCPICHKPLKTNFKSAFVKHLLTHTKELKFSCKVCNKKFRRSDHMRAHEKRHVTK